MKRLITFLAQLTLVICSVALANLTSIAQTTADEILARMDEIDDATTYETSRIEMKLFQNNSEVRRRELLLRVVTDEQGLTSALLEFTEPADIRGLMLLTIQTAKGDNQRIYLPALRRIQRIAGKSRSDRFAGSDLSYEDLRIRERQDYSSTLLETTDSVWIIQSTPKDDSSPYSKIVAEIDKKMYVIVKARYFDKKMKLWKMLEASDFTLVTEDTWRAKNVTMTDIQSDRRTELRYLEHDLSTAIPQDVFSDRYLRRGSR